MYSQLARSITTARIQLENRFGFMKELDSFLIWLKTLIEKSKSFDNQVK